MVYDPSVDTTGNAVSNLNGNFKTTYADQMERVIPDGKKILQRIKFLSKDKQPGNAFHQPIVLQMEHGITFADPDEGAFALQAPISGYIKNAVVKGYQMVLRSALSYQAAARAMGPGERAFEDATKYLVGAMLESMQKALEVECLYGQKGYGVVKNAETAGANVVIELTDASWAAGIWAGSKGMLLDVADPTNTSLVGANSGANALQVKAVSLENKTITVTTLNANLAGGENLYRKGAFGKEFAGIHKILSNTGVLFEIDASQFELWKGSEFAPSVESVLSFAILQQAISRGVEKGLESDVVAFVNPSHWDDLLTEQAALRMFDSSYKADSAESGSRAIKFHSQNGMVEIVPSIYVKQGHCFILCEEDWVRIGSTDVTFKRPGQGDNFFLDVPDYAGYELRAYTDQSIFCKKPGRSILVTNLKAS